jgi:hypothetical protein
MNVRGAALTSNDAFSSSSRQTFYPLTLLPEETEEETERDLDAEEAGVDRQLRAFEAAERAEIEQEDTHWRQRVRDGYHDGKRMFEGTGVIPKGSMNPFNDTLPRT